MSKDPKTFYTPEDIAKKQKTDYKIYISKETSSRITAYKDSLSNGTIAPGQRLANVIKMRLGSGYDVANLKSISDDLFFELIMQTRDVVIPAESSSQITQWTSEERRILADASVMVSGVKFYTNGVWREPNIQIHATPVEGDIVFCCGTLLKNNYMQGGTEDFNEVTNSQGDIDYQKYLGLYIRRALPTLVEISENAGPNGAIVTFPCMGGGAFAGKFKGQLEAKFKQVLKDIITEHSDKLQGIKAIIYDPNFDASKGIGLFKNDTSLDEETTIGGIDFITKSGDCGAVTSLSRKPEEYGAKYQNCKLVKFAAWDLLSFPGNEGNYKELVKTTDDSVFYGRTNTPSKITGQPGHFDANEKSYVSDSGQEWAGIIGKDYDDRQINLYTQGRTYVVDTSTGKNMQPRLLSDIDKGIGPSASTTSKNPSKITGAVPVLPMSTNNQPFQFKGNPFNSGTPKDTSKVPPETRPFKFAPPESYNTPKQNYRVIVSQDALESVIKVFKAGMGVSRLNALLGRNNIQDLSNTEIIDYLLQAKRLDPSITAAFSEEELAALRGISISVPVDIYTDANTRANSMRLPKSHSGPFQGTLLFTSGIDLSSGHPDRKSIYQSGGFDSNLYNNLLEQRILPLLIDASTQSGRQGAFVNIPHDVLLHGCSGEIPGSRQTEDSLILLGLSQIIANHQHVLGNLRAIRVSGINNIEHRYSGQAPNGTRIIFTNKDFGPLTKPQDDYKSCKFFSIARMEPERCPGDDASSKTYAFTSDASAQYTSTNAASKISGVEGRLDKSYGFFWEPSSGVWWSDRQENRLKVLGNVTCYGTKGESIDVNSLSVFRVQPFSYTGGSNAKPTNTGFSSSASRSKPVIDPLKQKYNVICSKAAWDNICNLKKDMALGDIKPGARFAKTIGSTDIRNISLENFADLLLQAKYSSAGSKSHFTDRELGALRGLPIAVHDVYIYTDGAKQGGASGTGPKRFISSNKGTLLFTSGVTLEPGSYECVRILGIDGKKFNQEAYKNILEEKLLPLLIDASNSVTGKEKAYVNISEDVLLSGLPSLHAVKASGFIKSALESIARDNADALQGLYAVRFTLNSGDLIIPSQMHKNSINITGTSGGKNLTWPSDNNINNIKFFSIARMEPHLYPGDKGNTDELKDTDGSAQYAATNAATRITGVLGKFPLSGNTLAYSPVGVSNRSWADIIDDNQQARLQATGMIKCYNKDGSEFKVNEPLRVSSSKEEKTIYNIELPKIPETKEPLKNPKIKKSSSSKSTANKSEEQSYEIIATSNVKEHIATFRGHWERYVANGKPDYQTSPGVIGRFFKGLYLSHKEVESITDEELIELLLQSKETTFSYPKDKLWANGVKELNSIALDILREVSIAVPDIKVYDDIRLSTIDSSDDELDRTKSIESPIHKLDGLLFTHPISEISKDQILPLLVYANDKAEKDGSRAVIHIPEDVLSFTNSQQSYTNQQIFKELLEQNGHRLKNIAAIRFETRELSSDVSKIEAGSGAFVIAVPKFSSGKGFYDLPKGKEFKNCKIFSMACMRPSDHPCVTSYDDENDPFAAEEHYNINFDKTNAAASLTGFEGGFKEFTFSNNVSGCPVSHKETIFVPVLSESKSKSQQPSWADMINYGTGEYKLKAVGRTKIFSRENCKLEDLGNIKTDKSKKKVHFSEEPKPKIGPKQKYLERIDEKNPSDALELNKDLSVLSAPKGMPKGEGVTFVGEISKKVETKEGSATKSLIRVEKKAFDGQGSTVTFGEKLTESQQAALKIVQSTYDRLKGEGVTAEDMVNFVNIMREVAYKHDDGSAKGKEVGFTAWQKSIKFQLADREICTYDEEGKESKAMKQKMKVFTKISKYMQQEAFVVGFHTAPGRTQHYNEKGNVGARAHLVVQVLSDDLKEEDLKSRGTDFHDIF